MNLNFDALGYKADAGNRRLWLIAGVVILGLMGVVAWRSIQSSRSQAEQAEEIALPEITTVTALGHLEPAGEIIQLTAPTSAQESRVQELLVNEGDRVEQGQVIASGPTDETLSWFGLEAGRNPYEHASVLEGRLDPSMSQDGLVAVRVGASAIWLAADIDLNGDARVRLKIPARDVSIALERPTAISIQNMIPATVSSIGAMKQSAFQGVQLEAAGQTLRATVTRKAVVDLGLAPGRPVFALSKSATFQH